MTIGGILAECEEAVRVIRESATAQVHHVAHGRGDIEGMASALTLVALKAEELTASLARLRTELPIH
jgi:hypothetical protein